MLRQIGFNYEYFAREAKKVIVDADEMEVKKKTLKPDVPVVCDARVFMEKLLSEVEGTSGFKIGSDEWNQRCVGYREKYPLSSRNSGNRRNW